MKQRTTQQKTTQQTKKQPAKGPAKKPKPVTEQGSQAQAPQEQPLKDRMTLEKAHASLHQGIGHLQQKLGDVENGLIDRLVAILSGRVNNIEETLEDGMPIAEDTRRAAETGLRLLTPAIVLMVLCLLADMGLGLGLWAHAQDRPQIVQAPIRLNYNNPKYDADLRRVDAKLASLQDHDAKVERKLNQELSAIQQSLDHVTVHVHLKDHCPYCNQ